MMYHYIILYHKKYYSSAIRAYRVATWYDRIGLFNITVNSNQYNIIMFLYFDKYNI